MRSAAFFLVVLAAGLGAAPKPEFRAGVARLKITPVSSIWMSGYAARTQPSQGVDQDLFAKAMALEDRKGHRVVIVTTDLIGLPREITDPVAARLEKEHGLRRAQVLFNASHVHSGPVVWPNLRPMFALDAAQQRVVEDYARRLTADLFDVAAAALGNLAPAVLAYGKGTAAFAANRRKPTRTGVQFGVNDKGPVDHSVPVIDVKTPEGKRVAILFAYACHNTTLTQDDIRLHGDYAGVAQAELEAKYPGTTAMFVMLCGADQNPNPRGKKEMAGDHGRALAAAVTGALDARLARLRGPLRSAYQTVDVAFAPHTRDQFEAESKDSNVFKAARARLMLARYDQGHPVRSIPYPVQAIRFEKSLSILALGGEVVVDYQLRAGREYTREPLLVAGYSNDVMCYIPSLRVLREGGYEGDTSMIYYGQPGKFTDEVEETIFGAIRRVMARVGARP